MYSFMLFEINNSLREYVFLIVTINVAHLLNIT